MKALVVISLDVPFAEDVPDILTHLDPPNIPYFTGQVRVVVGTDVDDTIDFLEGAS